MHEILFDKLQVNESMCAKLVFLTNSIFFTPYKLCIFAAELCMREHLYI